jgi:transcriptional regulator with XRE-family HTH domain
MKRTSETLHELSQAVRDLRSAIGVTQQEFASRFPTAIRTVARWENNQPPRGQALVRLAQMAAGLGHEELAGRFVQALQLEMATPNAVEQPELKGWLDGVTVAFRYRFRQYARWNDLAAKIIEAVDYARSAAHEVGSREGDEFEGLSHQLRSSLEKFRGED